MNTKTSRHGQYLHGAAAGTLLTALLLLGLAAPLRAADQYLAAGQPDGLVLLAPPPAPGSPEEAADLATVRAVFKAQPLLDKDLAEAVENLSLSLFTPAIGDFFQPGKFPKMEAMLKEVGKETSKVAKVPKEHWKRPRPYQLDPGLPVDTGFGYPSSHSTRGTVYALILAELFPDKKDAILAVGRDIGWDRVRAGKHFPSDVQAGRVLGQAVFRELMASQAFKNDLAAAKAETTPAAQLTTQAAAH
jgi:acid phosphatase (class A)